MQASETVTPWYKQFWPWFIIALPASVVVAGVVTLMIAIEHEDSLVADDYYKQGLGINRKLAEDDAAKRLAMSASIRLDPVVGELRLSLAGDFSTSPEELTLQWVHPMRQPKDFSMTLKRAPDGDYLAQLTNVVEGRWHLKLIGQQPEPWRLRTELNLPEAGDEKIQHITFDAGTGG